MRYLNFPLVPTTKYSTQNPAPPESAGEQQARHQTLVFGKQLVALLVLLLIGVPGFADVIGENDITGMSSDTASATESMRLMSGTHTYVAAANQEVFRLWAYQNLSDATGDAVEVGVYDITSGVDGATLVASGTIDGDANGARWRSVDITPVALTDGNTYAVAWSGGGVNNKWSYRVTYNGNNSINRHSTLLNGAALPGTWTSGAAHGHRGAMYAETQSGSGGSSAPILESSSYGETGGLSGSYLYALPTGIVAGDLLVMIVGTDDNTNSQVLNDHPDWTRFLGDAPSSGTATIRCAAYYRIADGTEGSTETFSWNVTETSAGVLLRISGQDATTPIVGAVIDSVETESASPNPPASNPGTSNDYLWITGFCSDGGNDATTPYHPAGYTAVHQATGGYSGSNIIAVAQKTATASSEDPGAMSLAAAEGHVGFTFAINPAGGNPPSSPSTPSSLTVPASDDDGTFTVTWSSSTGATSYELERQPSGGVWTSVQNTSSTTYNESGLTSDTYYYRVKACAGAQCSGWSATQSVNVTGNPPPTGAAPVLESSSYGETGGLSGSYLYALPTGIVAGDLLVMIVGTDDNTNSQVLNDHPDWTRFLGDAPSSGTATIRCAAYYRIADGTEGSTETFSWNVTETSAGVLLRISGQDATTPIVGAVIDSVETESASPNPPASNPGTSNDYLWITGFCSDGGNDATTPYHPAGYTAVHQATGGYSGSNIIAVAQKTATASSEDPGAMSLAAAEGHVGFTFAINPVGGNPPPTQTDIIGEDDIEGMSSETASSTESMRLMSGTHTYVASANQEVFRLWAYQNLADATGDAVEVGVYDITSGVDGATLVTSGTINGDANGQRWRSVDITPAALTDGNTYAVAWSGGGTNSKWSYRVVYNGNDSINRHSTLLNGAALPGSWTSGASHGHRGAMYAEVQSSGSGGAPATPSSLTVPTSDADGTFTVTWGSSSGATYYDLQRQPSGGSFADVQNTSATSYSESGLTFGTYNYRVRACNTSCSAWSATQSVNVTGNPAAPEPLTVPSTDADGTFTVTWGSSSGATYYDLERQPSGGSFNNVQSSSATSYSESGLTNGTYDYRARACNATNCGAWTATQSVTVTDNAAPPTVPDPFDVPTTDADGTFTVTWGTSSGATYYELQRQLSGGGWDSVQNTSATSYPEIGLTNGTYYFRVRACDALQCSGWSTSKSVQVTDNVPPPSPPAPAGMNDPGTSLSSDQIGTTDGTFRVDEGGAATYSIPINVAAGTAGVAPQLAMSYSSSAAVGIAGQGWSLAGLSSIARCRQTLEQDKNALPITWTADDRFCLDGQRLVMVSGTNYGDAGSTYRTEVDSGVLVTAVGSAGGEPSYFEARREDGSTSYYGQTPSNSDESAKLKGGTMTLNWGIRQYKDSIGNSIWFEYLAGTTSLLIDEIKYAYGSLQGPSGENARVKFVYETRADIRSGFVAGHLLSNDKRLTNIRSYNRIGGTEYLIRDYVLRYGEGHSVNSDDISRLTSIQECANGACLPKTTFYWRTPSQSTMLYQTTSLTLENSATVVMLGLQMADINGDGRMDFVWFDGSPSTGGQSTVSPRMRYAISSGSSYTTQTFDDGSSYVLFGSRYTASGPVRFQAIDINSDGRQDIVAHDVGAGGWKVFVSAPQGNGVWKLQSTGVTIAQTGLDRANFADMNSDGLVDFVGYRQSVEWNSGDPHVYVKYLEHDTSQPVSSSQYYQFGPEIGIFAHQFDTVLNTDRKFVGGAPDFNGDGRVDFAKVGKHCSLACGTWGVYTEGGMAYTMNSDGTHQIFGSLLTGETAYTLSAGSEAIDINADGLTDIIYPIVANEGDTDITGYHFRLSNGTSWESPVTVPMPADSVFAAFSDWNKDGYPDIVWAQELPTARVMVSYWSPQNQNYDAAVFVDSISNFDNITVSTADVDGDGVDELIKINSVPGGNTTISAKTRRITGTTEPAFYAVNMVSVFTDIEPMRFRRKGATWFSP